MITLPGNRPQFLNLTFEARYGKAGAKLGSSLFMGREFSNTSQESNRVPIFYSGHSRILQQDSSTPFSGSESLRLLERMIPSPRKMD